MTGSLVFEKYSYSNSHNSIMQCYYYHDYPIFLDVKTPSWEIKHSYWSELTSLMRNGARFWTLNVWFQSLWSCQMCGHTPPPHWLCLGAVFWSTFYSNVNKGMGQQGGVGRVGSSLVISSLPCEGPYYYQSHSQLRNCEDSSGINLSS